jgi:hypothetical protein
MNEDTIWKPHLRPGERVLWSADASGKLRRAEISRRRTAALVIGLATGTLAVAFGWKLYESFLPGPHQPDLGAAIAAPLYGALALTFAAVFAAQLGRLRGSGARAAAGAGQPAARTAHRAAAVAACSVVRRVFIGLFPRSSPRPAGRPATSCGALRG